jgi:hypothetical protein
MVRKNKKQLTVEMMKYLGQQMGTALMAGAVTVGMLELPDHMNTRITVPSQPAFVFAEENSGGNNQLRREREETAPHFISYSEVQRTPSRSGRS